MKNKKTTDRIWNVLGNKYFYMYPSHEQEKLEKAVYILSYSPPPNNPAGFYLAKNKDEFELPIKIYGNDGEFAHRVKKTWDNKSGNMGIILNGIKGSGKTVTSKMICNLLDLPIILVTHNFKDQGGINEYIASIKEDIVILIDEYEKIYEDSDDLLSVMDGALSGEHRRIFICTTNKLHISHYLTDRPNRIRYLRTYNEVSKEVVTDMLNDLLIHTHHHDALLKFIISLETITIDIIGNLIDEVNIHDEAPDTFKDYFNVTLSRPIYEVFFTNGIGEATLLTPFHDGEIAWEEDEIGENVTIGGRYLGSYAGITNDKFHKVRLSHTSYINQFDSLKGAKEGDIIALTFVDKGHQTHQNYRNLTF